MNDSEPGRLRPKQIDVILQNVFGPALEGIGFKLTGRRLWKRDCKQHIHHLLTFRRHSYALSPYWGLSLDYVPIVDHYFNSEVRWTVEEPYTPFSLVYDPLEYELGHWTDNWGINILAGEAEARQTAQRVLERTLQSALPFWSATSTVKGLRKAFEVQRQRESVKFGQHLKLHEQIAYAMTLAKHGRVDEGRKWLETWKANYAYLPRLSWRAVREHFEKLAAEQEN